ncbi:TRAP transporter large permease [Paenibacillus sp. J2TS4]|uniref:TRAP transporter large permease n=1 Tax=Paenibacillus sp. J2TS4 TaxID=2807194 RepID=UPI001BD0408C|nr:TRAP transporter large permease [Paenibacillus sp. J2TS4]
MMILLIFAIVLLISIILSIPIFISLGISALVLFLLNTGEVPVEMIGQKMFVGIDSFPLLAIPLFVLAGELMNTGSIAGQIVNFTRAIVGRIRGGLAMVGIGTGVFFSGISGSASADTAAVGATLIPAMKKEGYPADFSAGVVAAAGSIGPIIPPSIPLIIYGVIAEVSIGKLFVGGYIPGLMMSLAFILTVFIIAKRKMFPISDKITFKQFLKITLKASPTLMLPVIIMGGIVTGIFTATEAAAVAAGYAFLLSVFVFREIKIKDLMNVFGRAALTAAVVMIIMATANLLSWTLTTQQIPQQVSATILSVSDNPFIILLLINLVVLLAGMFLDAVSILIILTPIFFPTILELGVDPILFGVMVTVNLSIGVLTPPVGLNLFVASSIAKVDVLQVFRASIPFILCIIITILLMMIFPPVVTFLPSLMK